MRDPLLETTIQGPIEVHRVSLVDHAPASDEVDYRWFVALVRDPRRCKTSCRCAPAMRRSGPELSSRLGRSAGARSPSLRRVGYWYDASTSSAGSRPTSAAVPATTGRHC
jgi:hypothetical protein